MTSQASGSQGDTGAGAGDGGSSSFLDSMNEDMRGNELFAGVDSADSLGQKHIDLNTSYEELKSQAPAGAPEDISEYVYEAPEGITIDEEANNEFREFCKAKGLGQDAYAAAMEFDAQREIASGKAAKESLDTAIADLKKEHGDKYDEFLNKADKALQASPFKDSFFKAKDPAEARKILAESPQLARVFGWIGEAISQDSISAGGRSGIGDTTVKNEAGQPLMDNYSDMD